MLQNNSTPVPAEDGDINLFSSKVYSSRRFRVFTIFFILSTFAISARDLTLRLGVVTLRTAVFPSLRPSCLPPFNDNMMPKKNVSFALTTMILPKDGPTHWNANMRDMLLISERNKVKYCDYHGYRYINGTEWAVNSYTSHLVHVQGSERGVWFKPIYLKELLRNMTFSASTDTWLLYMDVDSIIVNHKFDLRRLIADTVEEDAIIISEDASGINTGVFLIRVNELAMQILDIWGGRDTVKRYSVDMNDQSYFRLMFREDGYLKQEYLKSSESLRPRIKIVRQCALQSGGGLESKPGRLWPHFEGTYAYGDFAVHFYGRPDKLAQMKIAETGSLDFWSR